MAETMMERIARAIYEAENGIDGDTIGTMIHENFRIEPTGNDKGLPATMAVCRLAARAAVEALRQATVEMSFAGQRIIDIGDAAFPSDAIWNAMLDALLTEGGRTEGAEG